MKKIKLFSATSPIPLKIEGEDVTDLSVNFYFVLNKTYGFTFLIDSPNFSCTDRNPIKLWKRFLIIKEIEIIKYMRRWERTLYAVPEGKTYGEKINFYLKSLVETYKRMGYIITEISITEKNSLSPTIYEVDAQPEEEDLD